jgi:predicted ATP-dependent endonuclease of OLD family
MISTSEEAMYIKHLAIRNFRAVVNVSCDLGPRINVLVGPNGVGKTTVLQAIRLTKAILAARSPQETQQVLISLGAASPHFPQRLFLKGLANDESAPIEIRCAYALSDNEIEAIRLSSGEIINHIAAGQIGINFANPAGLVQFLNSPQGRNIVAQITSDFDREIVRLRSEKIINLGLTIDTAKGILAPLSNLAGPLIGFLDQRLPPSTAIFSYFPADRALPMGEVNFQMGGPDAQQQLESHNSQPQLKYARLKNLIINSMIIDESSALTVKEEFEKIFSGLLRGRKIVGVNINELGLMSVMTEELSTGRKVELDSLSSGEKNIALTFLIVARALSDGAIALFDEPELHLNPAVSRDLIPFILNEYSSPRNVQFIMCTHSPEILSGAFREPECKLLHLKSPRDMTPVGKHALDEYEDALVRLGTSVSEGLFYSGTIMVEGPDDVGFLRAAFPELLRKFNIKPKGGRTVLESSIQELQALERKGEKIDPIFFIFDRDRKPSGLESSAAVRVKQWDRRCAENYMIDIDIIANVMKDPTATHKPFTSAGEVLALVRELAYSQINDLAARDVYNSYNYRNASLQKDDLNGQALDDIAKALFSRLQDARSSLSALERDAWICMFKMDVEARINAITLTWDASWNELCDGKRLLSDLHKRGKFRMSESSLKTRITQDMRTGETELWKLAKTIIVDLLGTGPAIG